MDFEPLYEAWEQFKDMIRRCPQHGYQDWFQIQLFYNGLNGQTMTIVDATANGTLLSKTKDKAHRLLEEMSANNYQWSDKWSTAKKVVGIHEVDPIVSLSTQMSALANKIAAFTTKESSIKETAMVATTSYMGDGVGVGVEQEQCLYLNNHNFNYRPNNLPTHYHPGLRNHENFSYANQRNTLQPPWGFQ